MQGLIVSSTGNWYEVWKEPLPLVGSQSASADGASAVDGGLTAGGKPEVFVCQVKGNFRLKGVKTTNPVAVGDHVRFEWDADRRRVG